MLNAVISAVLQIGAVLALSALIYFVFGRKTGSFWRYLGLQPTTWTASAIAAGLAIVFAAVALFIPDMRALSGGEGSVVAGIAQGDFTASIAAVLVIKAMLQTSLSEELFFRGLIAKRLINGIGFAWGNAIQAAIFAAVHLLLLFIPNANAVVVVIFVAFIGVMAWLWGWINEKLGAGSIIPGWIGHGIGNVLAYLGFAYFASV